MAVADHPPFDLIEAKLAPPPLRSGVVVKTDVIAPLCASPLPFASVIAPAGYGKTTLLALWAEEDPRPFAWVALDGRDDDAVLFLQYIAAALNRVEPLAPEVFDALSGPGGSNWSTHVPRLGSALASLERPLVLVLDDLHAIANPACLDVLAALCEHVPAGSLIATASREEPNLPLARWRTQGRLHEIGVTDLRLDQQEAAALLSGAGVELDPTERRRPDRADRGLAGRPLSRRALAAGRGAGPGACQAFAGDDRLVSEYFRFEILSRLPEAEARFLTHTSVLERMCGGLCDAVLETTRSAATLESLVRSNSFVVPLDRRGEWYRYHHLFGELLRSELERREPETVATLNARAMAWCMANDLLEAAVLYGQAAGETAAVAELVDRLALSLYYGGRMETLEEWLAWFDDDDAGAVPRDRRLRRLVARADRAVGRGRAVALPRRGGHLGHPALGRQRHDRALGRHSARAHDGGRRRARARGRGARPRAAPPGKRLASRPPCSSEASRRRCSAPPIAREPTSRRPSRRRWPAAPSEECLHRAGAARAARGAAGRLGRGRAPRAGRAQALVEETGLGDYSTSALAHVATARVALHEGRQADARAALTRAHRLRPLLDHSLPWLAVQVGLELTRAHLALGEVPAARTVFSEAEEVLELRPDLGSLVEDARELRERLAATSGSAGAWAMSLTGAELRLLPYLATHLTFPEIGARLFISRNTVKTEALAIYRKLDASSRSKAIERAVEVGLLESSIYPPRTDVIPDG